jgi:hypothetical protein
MCERIINGFGVQSHMCESKIRVSIKKLTILTGVYFYQCEEMMGIMCAKEHIGRHIVMNETHAGKGIIQSAIG